MNSTLTGGMVHAPEEIQQTSQALQLNEASHKSAQIGVISKASIFFRMQFANNYPFLCIPTYNNPYILHIYVSVAQLY